MTLFPNPPPSSSAPQGGEDINLRKLLLTLYDRRWLIITLVIFAMLAGYFYASSQPSIYRADALVQIEKRGSMSSLLDTLAVGEQVNNPASAELEILQSRMVMGETVDRLDLPIRIEPRRLPVVGNFLVNHGVSHAWFKSFSPGFLTKWLPGERDTSPYVWAGELLRVARFDVPAQHLGREHVLRVIGGDGFELLLEGQTLFTGRVGETVQDDALGYRLFVSQLEAHPGAEFRLRRISYLSAISQLQRSLRVSSDERSPQMPTTDTVSLFEEAVRQHSKRLLAIARAIVGTRASPEDVVQQAVMNLFQHRDRYDWREPGGLLRRSVVNEALEAKRKAPAKSVEAKKVRQLERELARKDKALAEAAALLVLKKKVQAIWGTRTTTRERGPEAGARADRRGCGRRSATGACVRAGGRGYTDGAAMAKRAGGSPAWAEAKAGESAPGE